MSEVGWGGQVLWTAGAEVVPAWAQLCLRASRPPLLSREGARVLRERKGLGVCLPPEGIGLESRFFFFSSLLSMQRPLGCGGHPGLAGAGFPHGVGREPQAGREQEVGVGQLT